MAYATGAYHTHSLLPVPPRPALATARELDVPRKQFVINATTGGYESMNATVQRVILLVAFALKAKDWKFLTDRDNEQRRQAGVTAREIMTKDITPEIVERVVTVTRDRASVGKVNVEFGDAPTGEENTLQLS